MAKLLITEGAVIRISAIKFIAKIEPMFTKDTYGIKIVCGDANATVNLQFPQGKEARDFYYEDIVKMMEEE